MALQGAHESFARSIWDAHLGKQHNKMMTVRWWLRGIWDGNWTFGTEKSRQLWRVKWNNELRFVQEIRKRRTQINPNVAGKAVQIWEKLRLLVENLSCTDLVRRRQFIPHRQYWNSIQSRSDSTNLELDGHKKFISTKNPRNRKQCQNWTRRLLQLISQNWTLGETKTKCGRESVYGKVLAFRMTQIACFQ